MSVPGHWLGLKLYIKHWEDASLIARGCKNNDDLLATNITAADFSGFQGRPAGFASSHQRHSTLRDQLRSSNLMVRKGNILWKNVVYAK